MDEKIVDSDCLLPTGKRHVSFSEVKTWCECPWRHKLVYIDKVEQGDVVSPILDFGKAIHKWAENFFRGGCTDLDGSIASSLRDLELTWRERGYPIDGGDYKTQNSTIKVEPFDRMKSWFTVIARDVKPFFDENFDDWKFIDAEHELYESICDSPYFFKGFVDFVISARTGRNGAEQIWILDWKTTGPMGWNRAKLWDRVVMSQVLLYKSYLARKLSLDLKDVKCGYVLLKRGVRSGQACKLITVSSGEKSVDGAHKSVKNAISGMLRGTVLKNRNSCKYCQFFETSDCT